MIVKGLTGTVLTKKKVLAMIAFTLAYSTCAVIMPFLGVFGRIVLEGYGLWSTFDYFDQSIANRCFIVFLLSICYFVPMCFIIFFYSQVL